MDEKIGMENLEGELVRFFVFSPFNFKEKTRKGDGEDRVQLRYTTKEGREEGGGGMERGIKGAIKVGKKMVKSGFRDMTFRGAGGKAGR